MHFMLLITKNGNMLFLFVFFYINMVHNNNNNPIQYSFYFCKMLYTKQGLLLSAHRFRALRRF